MTGREVAMQSNIQDTPVRRTDDAQEAGPHGPAGPRAHMIKNEARVAGVGVDSRTDVS
jgi:hypothetical protein